jgi:hypothetical protein
MGFSWNPKDWWENAEDLFGAIKDNTIDPVLETGPGKWVRENVTDPGWTEIKNLSRTGISIANFPIEAMKNWAAFSYNNPIMRAFIFKQFGQPNKFEKAEASTIDQMFGIVRNTTLGEQVADVVTGRPVEQGQGLFPAGKNEIEVSRRRAETYPRIYGQSFTVGRSYMAPIVDTGVIEPGSTIHSLFSGAIDATYTLAGDPINLLPAGAVLNFGGKVDIPLAAGARAGVRAKTTTTLSTKSRKILEEAAAQGKFALDEIGVITTPTGEVFAATNWDAYKLTPKGSRFIDSFVGENSGTAAQVWRASDGQIPPSTAVKLAAAETYDEVVAIFDDAVRSGDPMANVRILPGLDPRPITTRAGVVIKSNARKYRPFGELLPESTDFPMNNPLKAVNNVDNIMGTLEIPTEIRNKMIDDLFKAFDSSDNSTVFDWLKNFEDTIIRESFKDFNFTEEELVRITSFRKDFDAELAEFVQNEMGASVPLPWLIGTGGNEGYGPLYIYQMLKMNPVLIDPQDLKYLIKKGGAIRKKLEASRRRVIDTELVKKGKKVEEVITEVEPTLLDPLMEKVDASGEIVDFIISKILKSNILMRPRYLVRALPEEMARVYITGMIEHPGAYMMQIMFGKASKDVWGNAIVTARKASKANAEVEALGKRLDVYSKIINAGGKEFRGKDVFKLRDEALKKIDELNKTIEDYDFRIQNELPLIDEALIGAVPDAAKSLMLDPAAMTSVAKKYYPAKVQKARDPIAWGKAMATQIAQRASSPDVQAIAKATLKGQTSDQIANRFLNGDLKPILDDYLKRVGNKDKNYVWDLDGTRNYVAQIVNDLEMYSMGDGLVYEIFANGKFNDQIVFGTNYYKSGDIVRANKELADYLTKAHIGNPIAPDNIAYWPSVYEGTKEAVSIGKMYDKFLSWGWGTFYGLPSDVLSRNPLWNYARWQRVLELMPIMDYDEAQAILKMALDEDLPRALVDDMKVVAKRAAGELDREEVEILSSQFATKYTQNDLFSAAKKSRFGAKHRKMFMFYDAFRELSASAMKMSMNPKFMHKADLVLGELRQNTELPGSIDRDGDGKKEPWLYRDPVSGDEMFAIPMPGFLFKEWKKNGLDIQFGNTLPGLSMVTTLYPSLGPVISWPLLKILPDTPEFDSWRKAIAPYGVPDLTDVNSILQYAIPGFGQQAIQMITGALGIELFNTLEERQKYNQIFLRALAATSATKDYDPVTPGVQSPTGLESMKEWEQDAKELATKIYGVLGVATAFMPGAPITQWYAKGKNGTVLLGVLSERWSKINEEGDKEGLDYQDKLEAFVEEFGSEALIAFLQPVTDRRIVGSTSTKEFNDWYRNNREVASKYNEVSGYFAPRSSELDPDVWFIQKLNGDVKYKDPKKFAQNVQSAMANYIYNKNLRVFTESIPPDQLQLKSVQSAITSYKRDLQEAVREAYPDWDRATAATLARTERLKQITATRSMVEEPSLANNEVAIAAKEYLKVRDANVDYAIASIPGVRKDNWWRASKKTETLRLILWEKGEELAEQYPQFVNLWQNVLSREFVSLDTEE